MPKFYAFFDNGTYKVGCTGGSIYVFDQNDQELARFKGLSCIYQGAFRPGTNVFVAKSNVGYLLVYDLDTLSLLRKVSITRIGAQDSGFAFSTSMPEARLIRTSPYSVCTVSIFRFRT